MSRLALARHAADLLAEMIRCPKCGHETVNMEGEKPEDKRGLKCRYSGSRHFRVVYTRRG